MLNMQRELKLPLLNVSSLNLHLSDVFLLLQTFPYSIVVLNSTHHNDETVKILEKYHSNYSTFSQQGMNNSGGVLIAIHRCIHVQRVDALQNIPNVLVLDVGMSPDKFQLATSYSPSNEILPVLLFDKILKRNTNTILLGDFNAKHRSWSNSIENHKGQVLFNWLQTIPHRIVNKHDATTTRSKAIIDLILAPTHMMLLARSFIVLPSIGSDHFPTVWTPPIKLVKSDYLVPIKRSY